MLVKMGYQGVALLLAAVIGIGFAAYQYYVQNNSSQAHGSQNGSHTYTYMPPPEELTEDRRKRRRSSVSEKCSICYEILSRNVKILNCSHTFHVSCITEWFKESRTCPVCRCNA